MDYNKVKKELCFIFILAILISVIAGTVVMTDARNLGNDFEYAREFVVLPAAMGKITLALVLENHFQILFMLGTALLLMFAAQLVIVTNKGSTPWGALARAGTSDFRNFYQLE